MATSLVTDLVTQVRQAANVERSNFVTDPEIVVYLNRAGQKFARLITMVDDSVYQATFDFSVSAAPLNTATLPTDLLAFRAVKSQPDTPQEQTLFARDIHEDGYDGQVGYHIDGQALVIVPGLYAATGNPFRLYYVPKPTPLAIPRTIAHNAADAVVASSGTWGFTNGAFVAGDIGGLLTVAGAANSGNNGAFTILTTPTGTSVTTANTGLVNETFGVNVTAAVQAPGTVSSLDLIQDQYAEYFVVRAAIYVARKKRQDSLVASLGAQLLDVIEGMQSMRQSEPKQAPVLWGRRNRQLVRRGWEDWDL